MKKTMIALMAALTVAGGAAYAEVADADGDGAYNMDEMKAAYPDLTEEQFGQIDTDANGTISPEELEAAIAAGTIAG